MKKSAVILCLLFTAAFAKGQFTSASLTASGLTCSMCSKAIYQALVKVSFVESVKANIQESSYQVNFKKDVPVNFDVLEKAVTDAGFAVAKFTTTVNFESTAIQDDAHILVNGQQFHFIHVAPQTLQGPVMLTLIDKNYTTTKEYKRLSKFTTMHCYETGYMQTCCKLNASAESKRIFHVTL